MIEIEVIIEGLSLRPMEGFFGHSSVTLVRDNGENIIFDVGGYGVRSILRDKLEDIPIHKVFLSHLHFDHCANLSLFQGADVYVHQLELDALFSDENSIYSDFEEFTKRSLDGMRVVPFEENFHVSERSVSIFSPGHSVGHTSLEILGQPKRTVIAGDAIESFQSYLSCCCENKSTRCSPYCASRNSLKENYRVIVPGHSSIIEDGALRDTALKVRTF